MSELPTEPGAHYWRESDGDEWRFADVFGCSANYFSSIGLRTRRTKDFGGQWLRIPNPDELVELQRKADAYDEVMSILLQDGTRLRVGECFTAENEYPFFRDGLENYNARLEWDNEDKVMWYDTYPVSSRVTGDTCGGKVADLNIETIRRRKALVVEEKR